MGLTARQLEVLTKIREYIAAHGRGPTLRELSDALSLRSTSAVYKHLAALERAGEIEWTRGVARGISLPRPEDDGFRPPRVPVVEHARVRDARRLRRLATGYRYVDWFFLDRRTDPKACLLLRASDDGLARMGIHRGDLLLVEEGEVDGRARDPVVGAIVGDRLVARRYSLANQRIHLTSSYGVEVFSQQEGGAYVVGRVLSVLRGRMEAVAH